MPYNDDKNHSPSEFYYPEQTNDPKNTAERLAVKEFFGHFYKVTTNCNPTKPYNKSLINLICLVCTGKLLPSVFIAQPSLLRRSICTKNLGQYFPVQTSHLVNKSLILRMQ